jgi:hypothetical protein
MQQPQWKVRHAKALAVGLLIALAIVVALLAGVAASSTHSVRRLAPAQEGA